MYKMSELDEIPKNRAEKLFYDNMGLAYYVALKKYGHVKDADTDDLVQMAMLGLWKSCVRFDDSTGNKFSTYAFVVIWGEVSRWLRDSGMYMGDKKLRQKRYNKIGFLTTEVERSWEDLSSDDRIENLLNSLSQPTDDYSRSEFNLTIRDILDGLSERDREIFNLCVLGDTKQADMADRLGLAQSTISKIINKSKKYVTTSLNI